MEKLSKETDKILLERFGKDSIISLATAVDNTPYVRNVDAYYEDGAFYVLTHGLSGKMKQIEQNPAVAVSGEWFTAQGKGINLGYFGKAENSHIADKMRDVFSAWIDNGHNDFDDINTSILCIKLNCGILFSSGVRYEIDFT
ncbi:MAG: pyridoxamine 5'-phosphate oxidase family protein [Ruminococcaceae bacterium]|nr:pyridoxamine 5'-phosphate oxidase family protein [Oscillospiraceae bacterium]